MICCFGRCSFQGVSMRPTRVFVAALASVVGLVALVTAQGKADPREKLETAIPEAIRLLEAKEHETLLKSFVPPDELKQLTNGMSLEEFAKRFGKSHAPTLLQILQAVKDKKPTLDPDGKKATFKHGIKDAPKDSITFVKIDNFWYIQN
jgi:hypothetical protein